MEFSWQKRLDCEYKEEVEQKLNEGFVIKVFFSNRAFEFFLFFVTFAI